MSQHPQFSEQQLTASATEALQALEQAGDNAAALVQAWVAAGNAGAVQEAAERSSGQVRKDARRGLNVLKSRGVAIPAPRRKSGVAAAQKAPPRAWLLAPDAAGIRLLALSRGISSGAVAAALIYLRDGHGVVRVENTETTPNKLRARLDQLLPGVGYGPVQVPMDWARHKIAAARKAHQNHRAPEPLGFATAKPLLDPAPAEPLQHPFDAEGFEFSTEDARELAQDSGALHHLPEFRSWLPSQAAVQELLQKTGERFEPGQQPDQEAVSEFLKEEMLAAADRYFTPEVRADLVGRMKDAGLSVLARVGEQEALKLAATIQAVQDCGLVTDPPRDVAFLRAFFEKAVSVLMARGGGKLSIPVPNAAPTQAVAQQGAAQPDSALAEQLSEPDTR